MSKKTIIITAVAGLISFAGAFGIGQLMAAKKAPQSQIEELNQPVATAEAQNKQETRLKPPQPEAAMPVEAAVSEPDKTGATEKELKRLVFDVREKMRYYDSKLRELELEEQRLQTTHNLVKKDTEELDKLRIELASTIANLKNERDKLLENRVEVAKAEKANLITIAATYDKMDAARAGEILANMTRMQSSRDGGGFDDAVKILYYMGERTKAEVLSEMVSSEPKLAAVLCKKLKQVMEGN